jgi:hypothetical protein
MAFMGVSTINPNSEPAIQPDYEWESLRLLFTRMALAAGVIFEDLTRFFLLRSTFGFP